ncbi:hypothetical protein EJ110_NYTH54614, partial [Nymphaea thermarum]
SGLLRPDPVRPVGSIARASSPPLACRTAGGRWSSAGRPPNTVGGRRRVPPASPDVGRHDGGPTPAGNRPILAGFPKKQSAPFVVISENQKKESEGTEVGGRRPSPELAVAARRAAITAGPGRCPYRRPVLLRRPSLPSLFLFCFYDCYRSAEPTGHPTAWVAAGRDAPDDRRPVIAQRRPTPPILANEYPHGTSTTPVWVRHRYRYGYGSGYARSVALTEPVDSIRVSIVAPQALKDASPSQECFLKPSKERRSGLRIIPSGVHLPQWYLSWYPTFRCMFPDHLEECGLKEAISLAMQPINGGLVYAVAKRWNPRTNTFWFPWGEMTITLDEFSNIMGLPEPKGDPRGPIEDQFLVNQGQVKTLEVIRKLTGKRSWPFLKKDGHQYLQLQELGETYSQFVNPASLSRSVADKYKNSMVTCTAGLIFFNNEEHIMDFRIARLFRKWGHVKVHHISIAMAAFAFLYRGLTKFSIGDADSIEGCVFALQAWFYKHVGPQSCHFQNTDGQLSSMEHCCRKMEEVDDSTIIWDFFDREFIKSRYTYNPVRGSLLLGPFFIVEYHPERCLRQLSLRQRKAYPIESEGAIVECELDTKEWEDTKKNSRSQNAPANIVANAAIFKKEKSEYPKNKGVMDRASGSSSGTKNKHLGWGYDRKFTPLQQSYEEVMHMLIERGHDTEDCLVLKNIMQDAVEIKIIKEDGI